MGFRSELSLEKSILSALFLAIPQGQCRLNGEGAVFRISSPLSIVSGKILPFTLPQKNNLRNDHFIESV